MANEITVGTYTGNGSSVNIILGYVPSFFQAKRSTGLEDAFFGNGIASTGAAQLIRGATGSMVRIESKGFEIADFVNADGSGFKGLIARSSVAISGAVYAFIAARGIEGG